MVLNCSPDLIEITIFNVLTIFIQEKQAAEGHQEDFLKLYTYKENKSRPLAAMFLMAWFYLKNLGRDHQGTFVPIYF